MVVSKVRDVSDAETRDYAEPCEEEAWLRRRLVPTIDLSVGRSPTEQAKDEEQKD